MTLPSKDFTFRRSLHKSFSSLDLDPDPFRITTLATMPSKKANAKARKAAEPLKAPKVIKFRREEGRIDQGLLLITI
jgi:hypothetical protein